jgi:drug/metabolite transporter (DMT)-like permease
MQTAIYTILALVAFAANSVLCRVALRNGAIDPASFSTIRFASGALTLLLVTAFAGKRALAAGSWTSAGILFFYAIPFSFAYTRLSAAAGALILFGVVQLTMITAGLWKGERPRPLQWFGVGLSIVGLVYLLLPGFGTPSLPGAALMSMAGFGWGAYSLRGRGAASPLAQTTNNFVRCIPLLLAASLLTMSQIHIEGIGALFAVMSGVVASGAGYVIWYSALRGLTATRAAVVQLAVPVLAAAAGVAFLGEMLSPRLVISAALVLGGIAIAIGGLTPHSPQMKNDK